MIMMKEAAERAMALVDGQLAPEEVPELVQKLARNPALVAELQTYLATAGRRIGEPFEAKRSESVPPWLIDAIMRAPAARSRTAQPVGRGRALIEHLRRSYRVPAWLLAAGPAMAAVVVGLALQFATSVPGQSGPFEASLAIALERRESGRDAPVVTLRPVLSFKSKAAGWCRQYELRYAARQASHGLACRNERGRWDVVAVTPPRPTGLMPAGSGARGAIDDLVTSMLGDQPLSGTEEMVRISKGWSRL